MAAVIQGNWEDESEIFSSFSTRRPNNINIIYADYESDGNDGNARVVYIENGQWYEVHGSHCSCYGLEGQWKPEESSYEAIITYKYWSPEAIAAFYGAYRNPPPAVQWRFYKVTELRKYEYEVYATSEEEAREIYQGMRWDLSSDFATISRISSVKALP